MIEKNRKNYSEIGFFVNVELSKVNNVEDGIYNRLVVDVSVIFCCYCSDFELLFVYVSFLFGVFQCKEYRNGIIGCFCLGKFKCYVVERKMCEMDYLVFKEIMESISFGEIMIIKI